jgi:hypothetical protein
MSDLEKVLNEQAGMSDEDFMAQDFEATPEPLEQEPANEEPEITDDNANDLDEGNEQEESNDGEQEQEETEEPELDINNEPEVDEGEELQLEEDADAPSDFEKLITAPFKANGKTVQVNSAEEAIKLMQMGANYNKKMTGLKDNLKRLKMLENNDLLDDDKLAFLIDLSKNDKGAINKLLKDANIDPLDLESDTNYAPKTYNVNDSQLVLDEVLDSIRDTPSFNETINVVGTKWDESSRQALVENPNQIAVINAHIDSGVFKQITDTIEQQRMLGNLTGMSDIQAYEAVGAKLYPPEQNTESVPVSNVAYKQPAIKKEDPTLQRKKKALSSNKARKPKQKQPDDNLSNLSDEDFLKATDGMFL